MTGRRIHASLAALGLGFCLSTGAAAADDRSWAEMSQTEVEHAVDDALKADGNSAIAAVVRARLPADYPGLLRRMAATLRSDLSTADFYWHSRLEMDRLYNAHKETLAKAPTAELMVLARAEATYVHALQANGPAACAQYVMGDTMIAAPSGDNASEAAIQAADVAHIEAIRAGLDVPQTRAPAAAPEFAAWETALVNHEGRKLAAQYLDKGWLGKAGQRDTCAALVAYFDGFLALPPESGAKLFLDFYGSWRSGASPKAAKVDVTTEAEARRIVDSWAAEAVPNNLQAALKSTLPADYERLLDQMTPLVLAGLAQDDIDDRKYDILFGLPLAHLDDIKAAPVDALQAWARTESAYFHAAQADGPAVCVSVVSRLNVDTNGKSNLSLTPFLDSFVARLRLIRAGIDRPTPREDIVAADRDAWTASIAKRIGEQRTTELRDPTWRGAAPHKVLCAADVAAFDALLETPPANAAPLMALSATGASLYGDNPFVGASLANAEKALDQALDTMPRADFTQALKANLPEEYSVYRREIAELLRKGGTGEQVRAKVEVLVSDVEQRRERDLMTAPAPLLVDFFAKQAALLRILREEDVGRCASAMFQATGPVKSPSARASQAATVAFAAEFKAIRAGKDKPVLRGGATDKEIEAWAEAFATAVPARIHDAYLEDPELHDATDQDRCAVAIALYTSLFDFSDEAAVRLYKSLNESGEDEGAPSVASLGEARGLSAL